jgi:hypothetical protein
LGEGYRSLSSPICSFSNPYLKTTNIYYINFGYDKIDYNSGYMEFKGDDLPERYQWELATLTYPVLEKGTNGIGGEMATQER